MTKLRHSFPTSLSIALWLTGAIWLLAIVAHVFDAPHEIVTAAFVFGVLSGVVEWVVRRQSGR
jgi:hypothetical protein